MLTQYGSIIVDRKYSSSYLNENKTYAKKSDDSSNNMFFMTFKQLIEYINNNESKVKQKTGGKHYEQY